MLRCSFPMCERTKVWPSQLQQQCSLNFCLDGRLISQLHSSSTEGKKHFLNAIHHEESKWTDLCVISSTVITHSFRFRGLRIELVLLCIKNNRISEQLQGYNLWLKTKGTFKIFWKTGFTEPFPNNWGGCIQSHKTETTPTFFYHEIGLVLIHTRNK